MALPHLSFTFKATGRMRELRTDVAVFPIVSMGTTLVRGNNGQKFSAIWDTGATGSAITSRIVSELGLVATGQAQVGTANGTTNVPTFLVSFGLPNMVRVDDIRVSQANLPSGTDILIGMDIIGEGDLAVTNRNGLTVFSFRFPSAAEIDFVSEDNKANARKASSPQNRRPAPRRKRKKR